MRQKNVIPLFPGHTYHIFNRANGSDKLFSSESNYHYFLRLGAKHVSPIARVHAYCLLGNHFHLLIEMKSERQFPPHTQEKNSSLSMPFSNWFNAYAQAFNKMHQRSGSLFQKPFKRVLIENETQWIRTISYIHANPQKHHLTTDFRLWKYSSYNLYTKPKTAKYQTLIEPSTIEDVLRAFGGASAFLKYHDALHERIYETQNLG